MEKKQTKSTCDSRP